MRPTPPTAVLLAANKTIMDPKIAADLVAGGG